MASHPGPPHHLLRRRRAGDPDPLTTVPQGRRTPHVAADFSDLIDPGRWQTALAVCHPKAASPNQGTAVERLSQQEVEDSDDQTAATGRPLRDFLARRCITLSGSVIDGVRNTNLYGLRPARRMRSMGAVLLTTGTSISGSRSKCIARQDRCTAPQWLRCRAPNQAENLRTGASLGSSSASALRLV